MLAERRDESFHRHLIVSLGNSASCLILSTSCIPYSLRPIYDVLHPDQMTHACTSGSRVALHPGAAKLLPGHALELVAVSKSERLVP